MLERIKVCVAGSCLLIEATSSPAADVSLLAAPVPATLSKKDAYFTVLDSEVTDIHMLFMHILHKKKGNLEATLLEYGEQLSKILFQKDTYAIYRNRYLYWNDSLNQKWKKNHQDQTQIFTQVKDNNSIELEKMFYLQGVIHALIKRNFQENWSKQEFLKKFKLHIYWVMKGVDNNGNG